MTKFISISDGNEIKIGDEITIVSVYKNSVGGITKVYKNIIATRQELQKLIKDGKVKKVEGSSNDFDFLWNNSLERISKKTNWKVEKVSKILETLYKDNPWATTQFILKEIAIELDKKYKDHINDSEKIFAITAQDGKIHEICKESIKSYRAFPAFRSVEDAKIAYSITKELLKNTFKNA